jgi:hypothetical protein
MAYCFTTFGFRFLAQTSSHYSQQGTGELVADENFGTITGGIQVIFPSDSHAE